MRAIDPIKTGLVLGALLGAWHFCWALRRSNALPPLSQVKALRQSSGTIRFPLFVGKL
jgi:hypothetical protein